MRDFLIRLVLAAAATLLVAAPTLHAQQGDQDPAAAAPHQPQTSTSQTPSGEAQMPASGDITTYESKTFTGRILKENGELVLKDPVTKVTYKLDDPAKAKQYTGKSVRVTGKLDMNSNKILMQGIEPLS